MAWQKHTLTTADDTLRVSFKGRGSVYAEGTFGSGTIGAHPVAKDLYGVRTVSTGFLDDSIDGSAIKTLDVPAGEYELILAGSTGATVDVYYNDQVGLVVD